MLRFFFILLLSLIFKIDFSYSASIKFVGACDEKALIETNIDLDKNKNISLGKFTLEILEQFNIPYIGSEYGFNSIFQTPTGINAIEVISETNFLAYGWCYSLNGFSPEVYPHEILVKSDDEVKWWFGYATFQDGQWVTQCTPSYLRKSLKFCLKTNESP